MLTHKQSQIRTCHNVPSFCVSLSGEVEELLSMYLLLPVDDNLRTSGG